MLIKRQDFLEVDTTLNEPVNYDLKTQADVEEGCRRGKLKLLLPRAVFVSTVRDYIPYIKWHIFTETNALTFGIFRNGSCITSA